MRQVQKSFETTLAGYFSSINQREKLPMGSNEKAKRPALSDSTLHENKKQGAAFLAVYQVKEDTCTNFSSCQGIPKDRLLGENGCTGLTKHYCTNENSQGHADIDMECKGLLKNWEAECPKFKNIQKVKDDSTLKKGECYEVHAIEDLVQVGKHVKARSMANDAELVFCPYSYIINPVIRRALDVNIEGSILIIDESHNMEDICRDVGSVDVGMKCLNGGLVRKP
ncbi:hypothetical protein RDI58_024288 [Solanum bulbocastanum]|uniref:Helicase ATP-binding domain-containing protein n=1 Tax=Solanum bulbocastanum TaxID=147425 RepID=A0AAN8SZQ3_SOLBU